jgi:hypothetical protein
MLDALLSDCRLAGLAKVVANVRRSSETYFHMAVEVSLALNGLRRHFRRPGERYKYVSGVGQLSGWHGPLIRQDSWHLTSMGGSWNSFESTPNRRSNLH